MARKRLPTPLRSSQFVLLSSAHRLSRSLGISARDQYRRQLAFDRFPFGLGLDQESFQSLRQSDPSLEPEAPGLYAAACRATRKNRDWLVETWFHRLAIGQPLPTLPLWLSDDLAIPLDLAQSYEETCRVLRLP
jgi:hypothetical protein